MANMFFSSCQVTGQFQEASKKAREYVKFALGIDPAGCCRTNHKKLAAGDTAIVVCGNCANIVEENAPAAVKSLWEVIDQDASFPFPDYHGEKMTIQDCWFNFDRRNTQNAARSLLNKMNIEVIELKENFADTRFCGDTLLAPCSKSNAALAPKRYVEKFPHMFTPMPPEKREEYYRKHCEQIKTEKVACYCRACANAINKGGRQARHLLSLLFPA